VSNHVWRRQEALKNQNRSSVQSCLEKFDITDGAVKKLRYYDHGEYRDFGRLQRFLAIAVILHHSRDYRRTMHKGRHVATMMVAT